MRILGALLLAVLLACGPQEAFAGPALPGPAQSQSSLGGCLYTSGGVTLTSTNNQAAIACDATGNQLVSVGAGTAVIGHVITDATSVTAATPTPSATVGITTASCTVACASKIVSGAHALYGISGSATVVGTILVYDATSCPANGTVTPLKAYAYTTANAAFGVSWGDMPLIAATGIAVCFSSTGPYTATASTTAFLSLDYK